MKSLILKILFVTSAATLVFCSTGLTAFAKVDATGGVAPDGYLPSTGAAEPTGPLPSKQYTEPIGPTQTQQLPTTDYAPPQQNDPNYKLIVPIPGFNPQGVVNPLDYIKSIYNFGIGFGMLVAMAIIIYAGLKWTTSAGNISAQADAKDLILNAVLGVAMLLGAFLILSFISPSLTKLTLPELKPVTATNYDFTAGSAALAAATRQRQADVRAAEKTYESALAKQLEMERALEAKYGSASFDKTRAEYDSKYLQEEVALAKARMETANALVGEKSATAAAAKAVYDQTVAASQAYAAGDTNVSNFLDFLGEQGYAYLGMETDLSVALGEIENTARINWTHAANEEGAARETAVAATKAWIDLSKIETKY